jgi:DNA gyrase subunit A
MAVVTVKEFKEGSYIILITSKGIIKKMNVKNFQKVLKKGIKAINLKEEELIAAKLITQEHENIFIGTQKGQSIRFDQNDLRDIGRAARGVKGISLGSSDIAVGAEVLNPSEDTAAILTITEKGYGKRTALEEYRMQGRGGSGIKTVAITEKNGTVVSMRQVMENDEIMVITSSGNIIRMQASDISKQGRNTQGVRVVRLSGGETVADIAIINAEDEAEVEAEAEKDKKVDN